MNKLVIMRHGEAHGNVQGQVCAKDHLNFLTRNGVAHAIDAADKVAHLDYATAFASTLTRARHTMSVLLEALGRYSMDMAIESPLIVEVESRHGADPNIDELVKNRLVAFVRYHLVPAFEKGHVLAVSHGYFLHHVLTLLRPGKTFEWEHCYPYVLDESELVGVLHRGDL